MARLLKITRLKGSPGCLQNQRATLDALRLRKISMTVEMPDNPQVRGMIRVVRHLVAVKEIS